MAWLSDATEEFKKLPKGGKIAVIGAFVLVAGIGFYEYRKSQSASGVSSVAGVPSQAGAQSNGALSGLDMQSLANSIAGLVNAQQVPTSPTGQQTGPTNNPGPQTPPPPNPNGPLPNTLFYPNTNIVEAIIGKIQPGSTVIQGGSDARGQRFWFENIQGRSLLFAPIGSTVVQGGQGRLWLKSPGQQQVLLTGNAGMGGGPVHTEIPDRRIPVTKTITQYNVLEGKMITQKYKLN